MSEVEAPKWYAEQPWADLAELAREGVDAAEEVYAAFCNMRWQGPEDDIPWGMTWRAAGANVADMRESGEFYGDFFCSGNEGVVSSRVREIMQRHGYQAVPYDD